MITAMVIAEGMYSHSFLLGQVTYADGLSYHVHPSLGSRWEHQEAGRRSPGTISSALYTHEPWLKF